MLIFAFGHFISSQEDCVLFKMPGTSEKGGFSPASCSSPLRDPPTHCVYVVSQIRGCAIPRKDRVKEGQASQGSCSNILRIQLVNARVPSSKPHSSGLCCACRAGGKGWFSVSAAPKLEVSSRSTPSVEVDLQEIV